MKNVGAKWLVQIDEFLRANPSIIVNGFHSSEIPQSIDSDTPCLGEESSIDSDSSDDNSDLADDLIAESIETLIEADYDSDHSSENEASNMTNDTIIID